MGCCASIALGAAIQKPKKQIFVFDGDGAVLMQMGALSTIGHYKPKNLVHIVFDNESYDSTGGQPTNSPTVNFQKIALACGYKNTKEIKTKKDLIIMINKFKKERGPNILIIKVKTGSREDLGRPTATPKENKEEFMKFLKK